MKLLARPARRPPTAWRSAALLPVLAWLALFLLSRSPYAFVLGHEVLGQRRFSPPVATLLFAAGWWLMVQAMMLPGALPSLRRLLRPQDWRLAGAFVCAFSAVWMAFGFAFAFGDLLVHFWLEPRFPEVTAYLPGASLLAAGLWLLLGPVIAPAGAVSAASGRGFLRGSVHVACLEGWRHGVRCMRSCWALMLAMAAIGHGELSVMIVFACLMVVARSRRQRQRPAHPYRGDGPPVGGARSRITMPSRTAN